MRKYLIVGTGGTGGTIGSYLAKAGMDVTFIARGEHLQAMRENGLRVIRPEDEFTIRPCQAETLEGYRGEPDVVFLCVKGYSLEDVIPDLQRIVTDKTIIIPILNIFGTGGAIQEHFPGTLVTDGCIYVAARIGEPGCIIMNSDLLRVIFGVRDKADQRDELALIEDDLNKSGIEGKLSDNIMRDALLKFSYISPQGTCGLYYDVPVGDIQRPGEIRDCFISLIREIELLAQAMDIRFEEDIVKRNLAILDSLSQDTTASLQRDIKAGKKSEIDGLVFEVMRLADRYKTDLPVYRRITAALKERGLG